MMQYFAGKKVLITGGSSGIGRAAAIQLAQAGAHVAVAARRQEPLDETVAAMRAVARSADQRLVGISIDVADRTSTREGAAAVLEALGGLDVLLNNSGFAHPLPMSELSDDDIDRMTTVNYLGHVNITRALLPHFEAQKSGDICMVTSMLGFMGIYGYSAYCGSKFAIVGMAECLRQEMIPHNVNVTLFYPPTTDTPGLEEENKVKPPATWAIEGKSQAFQPEDVARVMLKGIARRRFVNMIGFGNWAIYYLQRFAPWLVRLVIDSDLKKHLREEAGR